VILDSYLKPWLLEVNVLPSLSGSSKFDLKVKTQLLCDTLTLAGIRGYEKCSFVSGALPEDKKSFQSVDKIPKKLTGNEQLTADEFEVLADLEDEFSRKGNFSRIYPLAANVEFY